MEKYKILLQLVNEKVPVQYKELIAYNKGFKCANNEFNRIAKQYAIFCIEYYRKEFPLLEFNDWIKLKN